MLRCVFYSFKVQTIKFTLNVSDVSSVGADLPGRLLCNLLFEPLDFTAEVRDDVCVLSNVV